MLETQEGALIFSSVHSYPHVQPTWAGPSQSELISQARALPSKGE